MRMLATALHGVVIVEPEVIVDDRGWFLESFHEARFTESLIELGLPGARRFVQDNHSCSKAGVLRGLHYQLPPHAQAKLVRVTHGTAFDVVVDVRRGSPMYGRWIGVTLTEHNQRQLWVPEGFAHGFLAIGTETRCETKCTGMYAPESERTVRWNDPAIGIAWPLRESAQPTLSPRDADAPRLADVEVFAY